MDMQKKYINKELTHLPPAPTPLTPPHIPVCPEVFLEPRSHGSKWSTL